MTDYTGPMETGAEESLRNQLVYCKEHRTLTSIRPDKLPKWCCEVAALEQRVEGLEEAAQELRQAMSYNKGYGETKYRLESAYGNLWRTLAAAKDAFT